MKTLIFPAIVTAAIVILSCNSKFNPEAAKTGSALTSDYKVDSKTLPAPNATPSATNFSKVVGWKKGETPAAPEGFVVTRFAEGLEHPRWIYVADNGDIFVAESATILKGIKKLGAKLGNRLKTQHYGTSPDKIILFRDSNKDGVPENKYTFIEGSSLKQPFGMLIMNDKFYVGNTDGIRTFPYTKNETKISDTGKQILSLPTGKVNRHWSRNIISNADKSKIFVAVGSSSNIAENGINEEIRRANILEINPDGTGERVYASGLRNPCGMDWAPGTNTLWTAVNERDELGDELVPDYLTSVKEGGFYGWPYSYFGQHPDPRMKDNPRNDLVQKAIVPDVTLGSHTASLGLVFYDKKEFPEKYHNGAFIGQHGSWNRSALSGYKVVFVPFENGKPSGEPQDFLTGFISDISKSEVRGRPVGVAVLADGSLLVADDVSNIIWRIKYGK